MRNLKQPVSVALIYPALLGAFTAASAQTGDATHWSVTPYIWATDTSVDLTFRDTNIGAGDISFGDSEGTFLLRANFGYIVGKRRQNRILFGFQYKEAEFRDGDLVTDYSYKGPMAGFNFRF